MCMIVVVVVIGVRVWCVWKQVFIFASNNIDRRFFFCCCSVRFWTLYVDEKLLLSGKFRGRWGFVNNNNKTENSFCCFCLWFVTNCFRCFLGNLFFFLQQWSFIFGKFFFPILVCVWRNIDGIYQRCSERGLHRVS